MSNIDYSKLNDTIVKQAYKQAGLSQAEISELFEGKIARARAMLEARTKVKPLIPVDN